MPRLLDKQPVSPLDRKVFCPVKYRYIDLARCLECVRLVRVDDNDLHVMQNLDRTWISVVNHYETHASPRSVAPGGKSTVQVSMANPNNRNLSRLSLVARLSATKGVNFAVESTEPPADSSTTGGIFFDDLGPVPPGESRVVTINLAIKPGSATGNLVTEANATGDCQTGRPGRAEGGRNSPIMQPRTWGAGTPLALAQR